MMDKEFISDAEMEALANAPTHDQTQPQPQVQADFISDADMEAMHPAEAAPADATLAPAAPSADQVEAYRTRFQAMINDPKATTGQIVDFMRRNGIRDIPQETLAQLAARERSIQQYGTYAGQAVVRDDQVQPQQEVSGLEALGQGIGQGLTFGALDEIGAGIGAGANGVAQLFGGGTDESMGDYYRRVRDENRAGLHNAEDQHPILYGAGQVAGAVPGTLVGGATSGAALAGRAALEGAAYGAGASEGQNATSVAQDAATGALMGSLGAGAMNRLGAMISPRVAPLVDKLMGQGVQLTPTQIMRASGGASKIVGDAIEAIGGRGVVTGAAKREADDRAREGVQALIQQHDDAVKWAADQGLRVTQRHPDMVDDARKLIGKSKQESQADMLANVLLGYGSSGATLGADLGLATLYSKPGAAIANKLLTGRQGPVPKALRGVTNKLSPLAGRVAAINTTDFDK